MTTAGPDQTPPFPAASTAPTTPMPPRKRPRWLLPVILSAIGVVVVIPLAIVIAAAVIVYLNTGPSSPFGAAPVPACHQTEAREDTTSQHRVSEGCLPVGFPKDIPLIDGQIVYGSIETEGPSATWSAQVLVTDAATAQTAVKDAFAAAGWRAEGTPGASIDAEGLVFSTSQYVALAVFEQSAYGPAVTYTISTF